MSLAQRVEVLEKDMKELKQIARIKDESLRMIMTEQLEFREVVLARFRQVDKRMDGMEKQLNARMDGMEKQLNARMDGMEKQLNARMDGMEKQLNARMDGMQQESNKRFDKLELMMTTLLAQKT